MIHFGKIDYLNLLPFDVFLKRSALPTHVKQMIAWKKGVPSSINTRFLHRKIDAAFISSFHSRSFHHTGIGIVAKGHVKSVIVIPNERGDDKASATSNALRRVLGLEGRVLIGDAALRYVLEGHPYIDMGEIWYQKTGLPFVFATLCYHKNRGKYQKISRRFVQKKVSIPQIILKWESQKRGIPPCEILSYLTLISYPLTPKAQKGLTRFLSLSSL